MCRPGYAASRTTTCSACDHASPMGAPSASQLPSIGGSVEFPSGKVCAFWPSRVIFRTDKAKRRLGNYAVPPLLGLSRSSQNSIAEQATLDRSSSSSWCTSRQQYGSDRIETQWSQIIQLKSDVCTTLQSARTGSLTGGRRMRQA
jgi:hypothetical protein